MNWFFGCLITGMEQKAKACLEVPRKALDPSNRLARALAATLIGGAQGHKLTHTWAGESDRVSAALENQVIPMELRSAFRCIPAGTIPFLILTEGNESVFLRRRSHARNSARRATEDWRTDH